MQTFLGGVGHAFLPDEPKERMRGEATGNTALILATEPLSRGGRGVLTYVFQAVYSRIGYINQNIWV